MSLFNSKTSMLLNKDYVTHLQERSQTHLMLLILKQKV